MPVEVVAEGAEYVEKFGIIGVLIAVILGLCWGLRALHKWHEGEKAVLREERNAAYAHRDELMDQRIGSEVKYIELANGTNAQLQRILDALPGMQNRGNP